MLIEDKIAIQELNYRYALHVDAMQIAEWVDVFAPDGVLDEREFGLGLHSGHDGLWAYGRKMEDEVVLQVHLMVNHLISSTTPDAATGTAFALIEAETRVFGRVRFHVRYEDDYVRLGGEWKFKSRVLRKSFEPEVISPLER
ncbi:nuclear transport factor 2 family protein [Sphingomonas sp.]|uniref:nuclear transport factor 2 family protein n=1 Tax=Sphingomonas sp. TaxID=28214 RepID=UPI003AFF6301